MGPLSPAGTEHKVPRPVFEDETRVKEDETK